MKKKLLSLALVFVMALTLLPTAALAEDGAANPAGPSEEPQQNQQILSNVLENTSADVSKNTIENPGTPVENPGTSTPSNDNDIDSHLDTTACTGLAGCQADNHASTCPEACTIADTEGKCPATTHKPGCIELCDETVSCNATTHKAGCLSKTRDGGSGNTQTPPADNTSDPTTPTLTHVPAKDATCTEKGNEAYYFDAANQKYYYQSNGTQETTLEKVTKPALGHERPADSSGYTAISDTQHSYTCSRAGCVQKTITEDHTFSNNICTVCGFERTSPSSPYRYIDITSAYVNSYSISVTWASDLSSGTLFDIYVDNSLCASGVAPSKSSGYFTYTVDFSRYLGDGYYDVAVYLYSDHSIRDSARVYNRYYDHDYDYWYDHNYPNSTPSTNSSGIPYASQVRSRYSASEAIRILRNSNHSSLQYDLLNSNSASNSFSDLEQAVKRVNNVSVQVDVDRSDVPSAIRNIRIDGAAFNASSTNSTVRLVVDAPAQGRYTGYGYAFSMSLTGVGNDSSLDVPVKITMPVPSDINTSSVRILHYHNAGAPEIIEPKVSGRTMSFTVTGFSDFVVTDRRVDPYYYYYTPGAIPVSARRNIMEEHLAVVLPILASMPPSGYVFDDVPPTYWAATEIAWARDGGMMSGYYDGTFRPYAATTRQELWMVLARLAGARPADMWAAREWAISAGISDGRNPHSPLSRQQMISMLYRYAQYLGVDVSAQASLRGYGDSAAISGYARNAMAWAIDQGILAGDFDGLLHPQDIATRADFAVYLYRFIY